MAELPKPERDTACFSTRQWFVHDQAFTTKEDAEAAVRLAWRYAEEVRQEFADKIRDML